MDSLRKLFRDKPYLAWDTPNKEGLTEASMVERILSYGSWEDYQKMEDILGIERVKSVFKELVNKKRVNLKPQTVNYFENYLEKYA